MVRELTLALLFCVCQTSVAQIDLESDSVDKDYSQELTRTPPKTAQEALGSFEVKSGFRIELVAAEPQVQDPIALAFDEAARLFVVEMRGYSEQPDERLGRIRRLEDPDGDGHYETATTFVEGLSWPTAVACYDGGVIVGSPPDVIFYRDTTGDGKADEHEKWFTGFGRQNVQGMMNSFAWGLDGRLYGTSSSNGGTIRTVGANAPDTELHRRDFAIRFRHDTRALEPMSGGGQHGLSFDVFGNRFVTSNSNHLQWVEFEDRYQARNPFVAPRATSRSIAVDGPAAEVYRASPVEPWRDVRTRLRVKGMVGGPVEGGGRAAGYFTGATGVTVYTGDAFPKQYLKHTHAFVGDVGGNLVHHKVIETDGLDKFGRRVEEQSEFMASPDNWFRPVQFANGPDGCLYVIDMYRETIEHPLSLPPVIKRHLDLTSGRDRGRIYRVVPNGFHPPRRDLPGDLETTEELLEMLGHTNGWHRDTAQRLLQTRVRRTENESRSAMVREISAFAHRQLATTTDLNTAPTQELTARNHAAVRALHCLSETGGLRQQTLDLALGSPNWWVRAQTIRLAELPSETELSEKQVHALTNDRDVRVRYQLALSLPLIRSKFPIERALAALARKDSSLSKVRHAILCSIHNRRSATAKELVKETNLLANGGYFQLTKQVVQQLGVSGDPIVEVAGELWRLEHPRRLHLLATLLRGGKRAGEIQSHLEQREGQLRRAGVPDAQRLLAQIVSDAARIATNDQADMSVRLDAVEDLELARFDDVAPTLRDLLGLQQPDALRGRAVELAATYDTPLAADLLLAVESSLPPSTRRRALDLLCSRGNWSLTLLDHIERGSVSASAVGAQHRQRLLAHASQPVRKRAKDILGEVSSRDKVVQQSQGVLEMRGDPEKGKLSFQTHCSACHRIEGFGHSVGPDLSPLRNRGAEFMLTNILDPNREVDERYIGYTVVDVDGRVHTGVLASKSDETIRLISTEGKTTVIRRDAIDEMRSTGVSLMPEGLERDLTGQRLADLIAYLISP